ncbi:hypothetical protein [Odoribacter laneus]|uniref:hypothetical protein n=1 Tax=Odoribacter laneus TaxID=626933 RepID=UPI003FEF6684
MTNINHPATPVAETIEVKRWDYEDLIAITEDLKGEETLESVFNFVENFKDEYLRNIALYDTVRFYSKVRFLILRINQIFGEFQKGGDNE